METPSRRRGKQEFMKRRDELDEVASMERVSNKAGVRLNIAAEAMGWLKCHSQANRVEGKQTNSECMNGRVGTGEILRKNDAVQQGKCIPPSTVLFVCVCLLLATYNISAVQFAAHTLARQACPLPQRSIAFVPAGTCS